MRTGVVRVQDIVSEGRRLTGGFHVSEDQRALVSLRHLKGERSLVKDLVKGRGIFRGPIFSRVFVDDPAHGEPYVSARDIVNADVRAAGYLSRNHGRLLDDLRLHEGMILVTCSGMNLGKAIWTRSELAGFVGSHDLIRIEPDSKSVSPGYLFAFLASRHGHALLRKQIYGGHIKHIEPLHVAALSVPRLGARLEAEVHDLVVRAARDRATAKRLLDEAGSALLSGLKLPALREEYEYEAPRVSVVAASRLAGRADAYYHSPLNADARQAFDRAAGKKVRLVDVAEVTIPGIFKRLYAEDPAYGVPYITGADVFELTPNSSQYLLKRVAADVGLVLREGMIVIQEAGQLGGLIGRSALVGAALDGFACSNNMVRVTAKKAGDTGYLFALLASPYGVRLVSREAAGSSIPHIDAERVRSIEVPWGDDDLRARISRSVMKAQRLRDEASVADNKARAMVEDAIEKGAAN